MQHPFFHGTFWDVSFSQCFSSLLSVLLFFFFKGKTPLSPLSSFFGLISLLQFSPFSRIKAVSAPQGLLGISGRFIILLCLKDVASCLRCKQQNEISPSGHSQSLGVTSADGIPSVLDQPPGLKRQGWDERGSRSDADLLGSCSSCHCE